MAFLRRIWFLVNIFSLDVVIAAMGGMYFFASFLEVVVPDSVYLGLGLVVWGIYTFDHLLDAHSMDAAQTESRRSLHLQNRKIIWSLLLVCVTAGLFLIYDESAIQEFLPYAMAIAALATGTWLLGKYAGNIAAWTKEILIALTYVAGISIFPIWQKGLEFLPELLFFYLIGFFILALINLWILSFWDRESDAHHGFRSIATVAKPAYLKRAIVILGILLNLLFIGLLIFQPSFYHLHGLVILLISHIHMRVFLGSRKENQLKRQILEASFLMTWLLTLVA